MFTVLAGLQKADCSLFTPVTQPSFTNRMLRHRLFAARLTRGTCSAVSDTMTSTAAAEQYKAVQKREGEKEKNNQTTFKNPFHSLRSGGRKHTVALHIPASTSAEESEIPTSEKA